MKNYTKYQIECTKAYEEKEVKPYAQKISIEELDSLLNSIGLYIDKTESWKYFNTSNQDYFLCWDLHVNCKKSKKRWANIYSDFYKDHVIKKTETYFRLKEIRYDYYSIWKNAIAQF